MYKRQAMLVAAGLAAPLVATAADGIAVTSDSNIKFYGFIRADATRDLKGSNGDAGDWGSFLQTQPIDGSAAASKHGDTYITARGSRLGLAGKLANGEVNFKLEGDFNGTTAESGRPGQLGTNSTGFRIRHAYVQYGGWLVGQSWSNFEDLPSLVETVQFNPPLTGATPRQPQIRYTLGLGKGSELSLALENGHSFTFSGNDFNKSLDLTGRWSYMADWGHVAARFASLEYRVDTGSSTRSTRGYQAGLSGSFNFGSTGRLVYGLFTGDGGGRYLWGSLLQGAIDTGTEISKFKSTAYDLGYTHNWTSTLRSNLAYSQVSFKDNPNAIANLHNKKLTQAHVNLIATVATNTEVGIELADGKRTVMNPVVNATDNPLGKNSGREQRINLMLTTTF